MGEIADMMLDGSLCEGCGSYIEEGEAPGYPRYCSAQCAADRGVTFDDRYEPRVPRFNRYSIPKRQKKAGAETASCPQCGKTVKAVGLAQHIRDAHPSARGLI